VVGSLIVEYSQSPTLMSLSRASEGGDMIPCDIGRLWMWIQKLVIARLLVGSRYNGPFGGKIRQCMLAVSETLNNSEFLWALSSDC
jgi:hypothetical protein